MRNLPVDGARIRLVASGKVAARARYAELSDGSRRRVPDAQDTNADGVPLWIIDCYPDDDTAERGEVVSVKVASYDEPHTEKFKPIVFRNLVALGYVAQGGNKVTYSFSADGIEAADAYASKPVAGQVP